MPLWRKSLSVGDRILLSCIKKNRWLNGVKVRIMRHKGNDKFDVQLDNGCRWNNMAAKYFATMGRLCHSVKVLNLYDIGIRKHSVYHDLRIG